MLFCNTTHHAARLHVSTLFVNSTLMNKPPPVRQQDVLCANYIVPDSRMRQVVLTHIYVFPSGDDLWPSGKARLAMIEVHHRNSTKERSIHCEATSA